MKHLTALLLVVTWLVLATTGIALGQSRPQGIVVSPAKPSLSLNLCLSRECLSPKERLTLKFTLDRAAYVYIYNIDVKGKVWLLFPNGFSRNPWVSKGEHTLPDSDRYSIVIEGPPGIEYIQAIAALHPIPLLEYNGRDPYLFLSADPKAFAAKLDTWLKGNLPQGSWATDWAKYKISLSRLIVTSWPPGAGVYVDGRYVGTTQKMGEDELAKRELWLRGGLHSIRVEKEGYQGASQTVYLGVCKSRLLNFWLEEPGRIRITSRPPGAAIYVDDRFLGITPKETELAPGRHTVELRRTGYKTWSQEVRIESGGSRELYASLRVNLPPQARFDMQPPQPLLGEKVLFDASESSDPDGEIAAYEWDFDDDGHSDAEGVKVSHVFLAFAAQYKITLTVTDDDGASDSQTLVIRVRARPIAEFTFSPTSPFVGNQMRFGASSSRDPDGRIVAYEWDFGDGTTASGPTVAHSYASPGAYQVSLSVRDDDGLEVGVTHSIDVVRGGELSISSTPSGAKVYLNEDYLGTTPLTTTKLVEGSYTLTLKKEGYKDWSSVVSIPEQSKIVAELSPWGKLTLWSTPADAKLYLDEQLVGATTAQGVVLYLEGDHHLKIVRCGYKPWSQEIAVASGETQEIRAQLAPIREISIETDPPGAEVLVDGRPVGKTPGTVSIAPSLGELSLIKEGYKPWSTTCITSEKIEVSLRKNDSPLAQISAPGKGTVLEEVKFDASGSTDPDGTIVNYAWEFGDGANASAVMVVHRYERSGNYLIRLTVTDDDEAEGEAAREVLIQSQTIASRPQGLIEPVPFNLGLDVGRGARGWSLGLLVGGELQLGGSISFTGEEVPDYYEVPPQPWEGEVYNLGSELELCALFGTPFIAGVSVESGIGFSFQQKVHIATMPGAQGETAFLPQRAVILPNGYTNWETNLSAFGGISTHLEGAMLSLRYHTRRGWIVGIGVEF